MELEVALPLPPPTAVDFNFDSTCSSPYMTAPSSPQRFAANFFFSAPTSPSRSPSAFYDGASRSSSSSIPFDWEEKPGTPKNRASVGNDQNDDADEEFAFDFSGNLERISLSAADELFDGGKIRPLKPPPSRDSGSSSVSSPRSPRSKKLFPLSPRHKKSAAGSVDPFAAAIEETTKQDGGDGNRNQKQEQRKQQQQQRGRERNSGSGFAHKGSRSMSPIRVSDIVFEQDEEEEFGRDNSSNTKAASSSSPSTTPKPSASSTIASIFSSVSFAKSYRKWKLRDFLLFRSASEGRATGKEAIGKYAALSTSNKKAVVEDLKNSSFRSTESVGSVSARKVSAHELHYTVNRAVAEEMKKKTFLPYKQGLLGCLGFNPGVKEISRGIGSLTRG